MNLGKLKNIVLVIGFVLLFEFLIFNNIKAQSGIVQLPNPLKFSSIGKFIETFIDFLFNLSIVMVPLMIVVGGFMFATAAGDPQKITNAKRTIMWSIIGFTIVLLSKGIVAIIEQIVEVR